MVSLLLLSLLTNVLTQICSVAVDGSWPPLQMFAHFVLRQRDQSVWTRVSACSSGMKRSFLEKLEGTTHLKITSELTVRKEYVQKHLMLFLSETVNGVVRPGDVARVQDSEKRLYAIVHDCATAGNSL